MLDKFVTFCDIKKESTYTKYLKYLTLEKRVLSDGDTNVAYAGGTFDYWVSFDNTCIEISNDTYTQILYLTETAYAS
jgi:hypothetical protein